MGFYINKNNYDYTKFVNIDENGITVMSQDEIQNEVTTMYKKIFGYDIDISNGTPDKKYIEKISEMFYIPVQIIKDFYDKMNPDTASGIFLQTLCNMSGITRKREEKSRAYIYVKYIGSSLSPITARVINGKSFCIQTLTVVDSMGREWEWREGAYDNLGNFSTTFSASNPTQKLKFVCEEYGPISDYGEFQFIDLGYQFTIDTSQSIVIEKGRNEESESELRDRRNNSIGRYGITTYTGLKCALEDIDGVNRAQIVYNEESTSKVIYVIINYDESLSSKEDKETLNQTIGETIYAGILPTLSAGCFSGYESYLHDILYYNPYISKRIQWCEPNKTCLNEAYSLTFFSYYEMPDEYSADNKFCIMVISLLSKINDYFDNMQIGETLYFSKLINYLNKNVSEVNGFKNFICFKMTYIESNTESNTESFYKTNENNIFICPTDYEEIDITDGTIKGPSGYNSYVLKFGTTTSS